MRFSNCEKMKNGGEAEVFIGKERKLESCRENEKMKRIKREKKNGW